MRPHSPTPSNHSYLSISSHKSGSFKHQSSQNYHVSTAQTPAPPAPTPTPTLTSNKNTPPRMKGNVVSPPYGTAGGVSFRAPLTAANVRAKDSIERVPRRLSQDIRAHDTQSVSSVGSVFTQHSMHSARTVSHTVSGRSNEEPRQQVSVYIHVFITLLTRKTFSVGARVGVAHCSKVVWDIF